ncbi:MAG: sodium:solute symporter family protein [Bryobacteraceae bacterium]
MTGTVAVFAYLAFVLYIGIFAFRRSQTGAEEFFLAGRSLGPYVFLLSLFGTHMTAFALLGASGHAFQNGIVTYGLMASSSALIVPLLLLFVGTRIWKLGKRHGFMTPVQIFRDRWECGHTGTVIFFVQALLLIPYIVIGVMGGGTTLSAVSGGIVPYWLGGAVVALVVMSYVFFGGMRGTAWVNAFQTTLFLGFGTIAVVVVGRGLGVSELASLGPLLSREGVSPQYFLSYTFIPLSAIAFPHIAIFCLTARKVNQFKRTVVLYPLCILAVWLPSVFLGVAANRATQIPQIQAKLEARQALSNPSLGSEERNRLRAAASGDSVLLLLLQHYAPAWLAGILGAGIMSAVMASDSQILALSTMFTEDIFAYYGGKERFGEAAQVNTGRAFVVALTMGAYAIALKSPASIFELAVQYAFTGFAALSPLFIAAFFWRGSTKWGALACTLWTAAAVLGIAVFQAFFPGPISWSVGGVEFVSRGAAGTLVLGFLPVVPITLISAALMYLVSLVTTRPGEATLRRYHG